MRLGNRIGVVGGTGFVGRELIHALGEAGYEVTVFVRRPERYRDLNLMPNTCVRQWDAQRTELLAGQEILLNLLVDQSDVLEAFAPEQFAEMGARLQKMANKAGIKRILHLSYLEADRNAGKGWAKQLAELEGAMHAVASAQVTTFRTSLLIGEFDDTTSRYRDQLKSTAFLPVYGADFQFQPLWVKDLAKLVVKTVKNKESFGQRWVTVGNEVVTLEALACEVAEIMGIERPVIFKPCRPNAKLLTALGPLAPKSLHPAQLLTLHGDRVADNTAFEAQYGFKPAEIEVALSTYVTPHDMRHRFNFFRKEAGRPLSELPKELL